MTIGWLFGHGDAAWPNLKHWSATTVPAGPAVLRQADRRDPPSPLVRMIRYCPNVSATDRSSTDSHLRSP